MNILERYYNLIGGIITVDFLVASMICRDKKWASIY